MSHSKTLLGMVILFILVFLGSFSLGRYPVPCSHVIGILVNQLYPIKEFWTPEMTTVVLNIRLPRVILAALVGCCLSTAGASYQGVFQNPMAAPDLLGATAGAAFGAAVAILFGASNFLISFSAFCFSLGAVVLVFLIGNKAPGRRVTNLILAGIMVGSLFSAGTSFVKLVADPSEQLPSITYWLMGSFSGANQNEVLYALGFMIPGLLVLLVIRWRINILSLGDELSNTMGVHADRLRLFVILSATLITAASVSVSGMIGWVGLVIPHLCRKMLGNNFTYLIPGCMLFGATFMLGIDTVSRNLLVTEIPVGILTAFIGAPFFIYLIFREEGMQS